MFAITFSSLDLISKAIAARFSFSIACIDATGSTAATSMSESDFCCTITLQGNIVPILSSCCNALKAAAGLHAPRMRYFLKSIPSFSLNLSWILISEMTPNPSFLSSSVTFSTATSNVTFSRVLLSSIS